MVTIGIDGDSNIRSVALAAEHGIYASVGVHPNSATEWTDAEAAVLGSLLTEERVVAVGETGLDFYRDRAPRARQEAAFRDHIALAKDHEKALVIHTRESVSAALDILEAAGPPDRFVFHCWSGGPSELSRAVEMGALVSFAGNVSFKSADDLRTAAASVPDDRILIETDSPYLTPEPHRGKPNEPRNVELVGRAVAAARGSDPEEVAVRTTANARRLFGLS